MRYPTHTNYVTANAFKTMASEGPKAITTNNLLTVTFNVKYLKFKHDDNRL